MLFALEWFGGLKNRTSIHTAKYADDIILLAKEETTGHG